MVKVVLRDRFYVSADAVDRVALKRHAEVADTSKRIGRMGPRTTLSDAPPRHARRWRKVVRSWANNAGPEDRRT
jgi:hypothetical protein